MNNNPSERVAWLGSEISDPNHAEGVFENMLKNCATRICFGLTIGFLAMGSFALLANCTRNTAERSSSQIRITELKVEAPTVQEARQRSAAISIKVASLSEFEKRLRSLRWIAFAPTHWDPEKGIRPSLESLKEDLRVLRRAGFDALVTYSADVLDPQAAAKMKFKGMILGIWDPRSEDELRKAKEAAASDIVVGFAVGNEGLDVRYDYETLKQTIDDLKVATGKPVTTSEQTEDYLDRRLLELGDWIFAIAHPFWHRVVEPKDAVEWTERQYRYLATRAPGRVVFLKEVGLPSGGGAYLNETNQREYYRRLQATDVLFCWFEGYDQHWKGRTHPVESHWGLFRGNRTPKAVVSAVKKTNE